MATRKVDHRVADHPLGWRARRQEARGAVGHQHVVLGALAPLAVVGIEDRRLGPAAPEPVELPDQVVGVLDAAVAAASAERAHAVCAIADEEHGPFAKALHDMAAIAVRTDPHEFVVHVLAELRVQALGNHLRAADRLRVGIRIHLVVQPPDVVGHQVLPDRAVLVERRLDPGPALDLRLVPEAHIGDAPAVDPPLPHASAGRACRAAGCGCRWHRRHSARARRSRRPGVHGDFGSAFDQPDAGYPVLPAQIDGAELHDPVDQVPLDVELLDVDEGRLAGIAVGRLGSEVEAVDLVVAGKRAAHEPLHALLLHPLVYAEPLQVSSVRCA